MTATPNNEAAGWTDEQIIAACEAAGIKWIAPMPGDDENDDFPGAFDIAEMPEMRRLFAALTPAPSARDADGEVVAWRMRRTNCLTGEWARATPWQDGAPDAEDVRDAERVSPDGKMRYRIEYAYTRPPAAVPADALERLVEKWKGHHLDWQAREFVAELATLIPKGADHGQR